MTETEVNAEKKNGYKKTNLGLIPVDWEMKPIKAIGKVITGSTPSTKEESFYGGEYLFATPADLNSVKFIEKTEKRLSKSGFETGRLIPKGSVLFVSIGSTIGKTGIASDDLITNQQINSIKTNKLCSDEYLFYQLTYLSERIKLLAGKQAVPILNKSNFESIRIPIPSVQEQINIAEFLAIWDKAIFKLEKLIKAKKRYKKGLMQRLLSGKVRFPEFEGEGWVEVKLGEVFDRITEKNESESVKNVLTISAQDGLVSQTDYYNKSVASKDLSNYIVLRQGDFAYNKSYSEGYPLGAIKRLDDYEKGVLSPLYICFSLTSDNVDNDFIAHFFEYGGLDHGIYKIAREGARNHGLLNVSVKDFFEIDLILPQYEEQKKIASVLNEAMKDIELLEAQLEKYQEQKKGLMQQLLTGKVRVYHE